VTVAILIGFFLIMFGTVFFAAGGGWEILFALLNNRFELGQFMPQFVFAALGFAILFVGVMLVASSLIRGRKRKSRVLRILERGTLAEGVIISVGPVSASRFKAAPFVVEYRFRDRNGDERTGRDDSVDRGLAERLGLRPGAKVRLKYLAARPEQGILLLDG
jgi:hypothetical protein